MAYLMKYARRFFSLLICLYLLCTTAAYALTYDANADFGDSNPNGVWSYGWTADVRGLPLNLTPYNTYATYPTLDFGGESFEGWYDTNNWYRYAPLVYKNYGDYFDNGNISIPAGALVLHGVGASPDYVSVVEFTAPFSGRYSLSASFIGRQYNVSALGPNHVYILYNGTTIFEDSGTIKTVGDLVEYSTILNLHAGDKIDFVVGKDSSIYRNNIELQANINSFRKKPPGPPFDPPGPPHTPLPSTLLLLGSGLLGLGAVGWRRRRRQ